MKKIRSSLAIIALLATLSCPFFFQAAGSMASAVSSRHVSAVQVAGKPTQAVAYRHLGWCPIPGVAC